MDHEEPGTSRSSENKGQIQSDMTPQDAPILTPGLPMSASTVKNEPEEIVTPEIPETFQSP